MKQVLTDIFKRIFSHSLAKYSLIVFGGNMIANVGTYLYHLLVGRILGPVNYGEFVALLSLFYIFNVPSGVLQTVTIKYVSILKAKGQEKQIKYLFWQITKWLVLGGCVGLVILLPFYPYLANFLHIPDQRYFLWLYLIFIFFILSIVPTGVIQGLQKFTLGTVYLNITVILRLVFGVIFAYWGVGWTLIGNVISNLISYLIVFWPLSWLITAPADKLTISKRVIAGYSVPTFVATLGVTLLYSLDVVLVKHYLSATDAGIYSALSTLGKVIFFASSSVGMVVFPLIAERKELKKSYHRLVFAAIMGIGAVSFMIDLVYFLIPVPVVHLLYGTAFDLAVPYVGAFGVFMGFFAMAYALINICLAAGKTQVFYLPMMASVLQIIGIIMFHERISTIILLNSLIAAALFGSVLVYYRYAHRSS